MRTRRLQAGEVTLEVVEAGEGSSRRLLLLHGWTGSKDDFAPHLEGLAAQGWHVAAPDLRGHGRSEHPAGEGSYSLAIFTADAVALADALGWPRFALLGYSMGGMVAQLLALEHPERVAGLVLMGTGHAGPEGVDPNLVELGRAIVRDGGTTLLAEVLASMGGGPFTSEASRALRRSDPAHSGHGRRSLESSSADMWLAMVTELLDHPDRLERLRALQVPTLVLVGDQDEAFLAPSRRMAEAIPGARLAVVPGAGHAPQFESPEAWGREVSAFLESVASVERPASR